MRYLFLFLLLSGCKYNADHYTVYISPALNNDAVNSALDEWEEKTTVAYTRVVSDDVSHCGDDTVICIRPADHDMLAAMSGVGYHLYPYGSTHHDQSNSGAWMFLDPTVDDAKMNWAARHEMGHALGLSHSRDGTLMCANYYGASPTITQADIDAYFAAR